MGQRGPAPKPVELKVLEGNRGHRPLDLQGMFRPEVGVPDAPKWLTPEARKAWRRLAAELVRYNLLSRVDREAFAMLCQTIGRVEIIERSLAQSVKAKLDAGEDPVEALVDLTPNKLRIQSVTYQLLNREQAKMHRLLESFGLRPDARTKVTAAVRAQLQLFEGGGAAPGAEPGDAPAAGETPAAEGSPGLQPRGFSDFV